MAGGDIANAIASLICMSPPIALPAIACALCSLPGRSLQSLSLTKPMPVFCPLPPKLKPCTVKMDSMSSFAVSRNTCSTCFTDSSVRSWVAPTGAWMMVISTPWSSSGRKPLGVRRNNKAAAMPSTR